MNHRSRATVGVVATTVLILGLFLLVLSTEGATKLALAAVLLVICAWAMVRAVRTAKEADKRRAEDPGQ